MNMQVKLCSVVLAQNFPPKALILQNFGFTQNFTPTWQYFYTDLSALSVTFPNSGFWQIQYVLEYPQTAPFPGGAASITGVSICAIESRYLFPN